MNPLDLKPFLDQVAAVFPGSKVAVQIEMEQNVDGTLSDTNYAWTVKAHGNYGFGDSFEIALENCKAKYDPEAVKRKAAAESLRERADRIENGQELIETQNTNETTHTAPTADANAVGQ